MAVILGTGAYRFEVHDRWAKLPPEQEFNADVAAVGVDAQDRVYAFNRGAHPMVVFDRDGNFLRSWGEGVFRRAHGVHMAPDDTIWLTDDGDHRDLHSFPTRRSSDRATAQNPAGVVLGDLQACDAFDVMSRISTVQAPTLVICGEEDQLTPPKYSRFLGQRIAGACVSIVPGAGHYVQVEKPRETTAAIREFLVRLGE